MRTLTLAIGNTSLFIGAFSGRRLERAWRFSPGNLRAGVENMRGSFDRAVFCSVVPLLTDTIVRTIQRQWKIVARQLSATSAHGLQIGYRIPAELGADRVAAALGAQQRFPRSNLIVVDCGTATTVTALAANGNLLGGAILPGIGLWSEALAARTAQLPAVPPRQPRRALGRGTQEGIASGVYYGHVGAIRETVNRVRTEAFGTKRAAVVGTGGNCPLFRDENLFDVDAPNLVLEGLLVFAERAAGV